MSSSLIYSTIESSRALLGDFLCKGKILRISVKFARIISSGSQKEDLCAFDTILRKKNDFPSENPLLIRFARICFVKISFEQFIYSVTTNHVLPIFITLPAFAHPPRSNKAPQITRLGQIIQTSLLIKSFFTF